MKRQAASERGQVLILVVFGIAALFGVAGVAIDGGNLYADRRRAQNAADAAALAGALARINGQSWVETTYQVAERNGYAKEGAGSVVEVHSPPVSGGYQGKIEFIQVRITTTIRTPFAAVVGTPQMHNVVEAVARSKPAEYLPMFNGAGVVSLTPTSDCDDQKSFWIHAEQTFSIYDAGIFVNSFNPDCALIQQANGSIRIHGEYPIKVVGGWQIAKPTLLTPYPPVHAAGVQYPPPFYMPDVGCGSKEATVSEDGSTLSSGNWGDLFPPKGVTNLESGVYCLSGDFLMGSGSLQGNNVLIDMEYGQMHISGGVHLDLKGRQSGTLAGLLVYQPMTNKHPVVLNATADFGICRHRPGTGRRDPDQGKRFAQRVPQPDGRIHDRRGRGQQRDHPVQRRRKLQSPVLAGSPAGEVAWQRYSRPTLARGAAVSPAPRRYNAGRTLGREEVAETHSRGEIAHGLWSRWGQS